MTGPAWPREATWAERADWDQRTVRTPGGHVYQSSVWAEQRARLGWRPLHVLLDEDHAALVLLRPFPLIGGASAYIPRGPVIAAERGRRGGGGTRRRAGRAGWRGAAWRSSRPMPRSRPPMPPTAAALRSAGFRPIPEIQPSRHRVSLALARDTDDAAVRAGFTKSTRQRIAGAERDGVIVERHDTGRLVGRAPAVRGACPIVRRGARQPSRRSSRGPASGLASGSGRARSSSTGGRPRTRPACSSTSMRGTAPTRPTRSAGSSCTATATACRQSIQRTRPGVRDTHPGVMHLLRWRAIQLAIREGCTEMDLGGVDSGPDHREPGEGDPMAGLYEHKRSFGARWVEMTGAHERVTKPCALRARAAHGAGGARPCSDEPVSPSGVGSRGSCERLAAEDRLRGTRRDGRAVPLGGSRRRIDVTGRDPRLAPGAAGDAVRGHSGAARRRPRLRAGGDRGRRGGRDRRAAGGRGRRGAARGRRRATSAGQCRRVVVWRSVARADGGRHHRHRRQDDDGLSGRCGPRGRRAPDRHDRHDRDARRRADRGPRSPRHDPRGTGAAGHPARDGRCRRSRRGRGDDVAWARARPGGERRLRRRHPDQRDPRASRAARLVGGLPRRQAVAVRPAARSARRGQASSRPATAIVNLDDPSAGAVRRDRSGCGRPRHHLRHRARRRRPGDTHRRGHAPVCTRTSRHRRAR